MSKLQIPDGVFAPYQVVRELGLRPNPAYVVRQAAAAASGKPLLLVAEWFAGAAKGDGVGHAEFVREARRIATLASPNLARVREVAARGDDLAVFGEFVDGEKLGELWLTSGMSLEIALRIILDALSGLSALHNLRDAQQQPMKLAHGEVSPATVVLGLDGVARVLETVARRAPDARAEASSLGYLAPEVHAGEPYDARADVFSAGVLLWEALSGKRLFPEQDAAAIVQLARGGSLPAATVPEKAAWATGLIDVTARALAGSPEDRWPTAAAMAAELRKLVGVKLAPASTASAFAKSTIGDRVKSRQDRLRHQPSISVRASIAPKAAKSVRPGPVAAAVKSVRPASVTGAAAPPIRPSPIIAVAAMSPPNAPIRPALHAVRPATPYRPESTAAQSEPSAGPRAVPPLVKAPLPLDATPTLPRVPIPTPAATFGGFVIDPRAAPGGSSPAPPPLPRRPARPVATAAPSANPSTFAEPSEMGLESIPPEASRAEGTEVPISIAPPALSAAQAALDEAHSNAPFASQSQEGVGEGALNQYPAQPLVAPGDAGERDNAARDGGVGWPASANYDEGGGRGDDFEPPTELEGILPRRRGKALVIACIGAGGLLVFGLAGWRLGRHTAQHVSPATAQSTIAAPAAPRPAPSAVPIQPQRPAPAPLPPPPPPEAPTAAGPAAAAPMPAAAVAAPKQKTPAPAAPVAAPPQPKPAAASGRPKTQTKHAFDPNSL